MVKKTLQDHLIQTNVGPFRVLIFGAAITTLGLWTTFQDPFNPVKLATILLTASWLVGFIIFNINNVLQNRVRLQFLVLSIIFLFSLFLASIMTDESRIAFIGENQRNNGFLMYFGLAVIAIAACLLISLNNTFNLFRSILWLGLSLGIYGLLQSNGLDPIEWVNPYNSVISTLGNPNFAAATMATFATIAFGVQFITSFKIHFRLFALLVTLILSATIFFSDARQGLIGMAVGFGTFIAVWLYNKTRKIGIGFLIIAAAVGVLAILGMLQIGPLANLLYKGSVSVRGYYWRAGIEMFKNYPIFGVGIDRYGANFKEYREVGYVLNYGFDISSSNAHNVIIQMFATGGIFVGTTFMALNLYVIWRAFIGLKVLNKDNRLKLAALFSAWLVYQATTFISIDTLGQAIWGWLLAGGVVSLSTGGSAISKQDLSRNLELNKLQSRSLLKSSLSFLLLIFALMFTLILFRAETNMFHTRAIYTTNLQANSTYLKKAAEKTINFPWVNPIYKATAASYLVNFGYVDQGLLVLNEVVKNDKRNAEAIGLLADYYTQLKKYDLAIANRVSLSKLDPWNAANYLELGRLYKQAGNFEKMNTVKNKILSFAPETAEGKTALIELTQ